jgi:hypothetical protein
MIGEEQIKEILAQYKKHGWSLRRVLLSAEASEKLPISLFEQAEIVSSELNAAWFSRRSIGGREAWELRYLETTPFALVEVFEEDDDEEVREEARTEMETRLAEQASKAASRKSKN